MRTLIAALLIAVIHGQASTLMPTATGTRADSTIRFPAVSGSNLEGRRFTLPDDFEGELNIVLVAFRREQQSDVDTWVPFLKATAARHGSVRAYELPTLNRNYRLVRGFIDGGMARGIPDKATRETTITLYIDKSPFKLALGIASEDAIRVFLVCRDGRVLWHADGTYDATSGASLAAAIEEAMGT